MNMTSTARNRLTLIIWWKPSVIWRKGKFTVLARVLLFDLTEYHTERKRTSQFTHLLSTSGSVIRPPSTPLMWSFSRGFWRSMIPELSRCWMWRYYSFCAIIVLIRANLMAQIFVEADMDVCLGRRSKLSQPGYWTQLTMYSLAWRPWARAGYWRNHQTMVWICEAFLHSFCGASTLYLRLVAIWLYKALGYHC